MASRATGVAAALVAALVISCAPAAPAPEEVAKLGHLSTLASTPAMSGVIVGVPQGDQSALAAAAAQALHASGGVGVVVAHGYQAHDIGVATPVEGNAPLYARRDHTPRARAVYREYVDALRRAAGGALGLYLELRESEGGNVEVATVGITRDEARRIKALRLGAVHARVEPLDTIAYDPWGTRNDGVLLVPPKSLSIMLPRKVAGPEEVAKWLEGVIRTMTPVALEPAGRAQVLDRGRFESIKRASRILVAAPHGSGDTHTDEVAARIAEHLGASVLVAHGFMGTRERANADRIAVNRPLEGAGIHTTDTPTTDAAAVYAAYLERAKSMTAWPPAVYIEIHCNEFPYVGSTIEIATVGISRDTSRSIKAAYREAAARARLKGVDIRVEHDDTVHLNAFGAKQVGILGQVPVALHIELPFSAVMRDREVRGAYADLLAGVLAHSVPLLAGN
jgi:hypothetical protein